MGNANKMKIISNPFKKEIEYQWFDPNIEEYTGFDPENSRLARGELINTTIQNRAYEIIDVVNSECNVGNVGLDIVFIGTDSDYEDLCRVINTYYCDCNINCIKDGLYYNAASFVMPKIKDKFSIVKDTLDEYTEDEIRDLIYKYNNTVKPSISLCFMGLYSAGKSAFINSIIGMEILPSDSDPTTAKVCKISCSNEYVIKFKFDGKECVLSFKGKNYKPNHNFDKQIIKELQGIVDTAGKHDELHHMNAALSIINNYKDEHHHISDMIEIFVPFQRTSLPVDDFEFVIYDTPGSNSIGNEKHFEVLRDSLDEQTNALPIFLTTPDTMDAEDNDKILKLIEETGAALDTTNAIVVVNKADEKGPKTLKEKRDKCKNLIITKWKSTRIFFVSSIIGIASKKSNPDDADEWLDEDMEEIYDDKKSKYANDERKLFEFNIVDKSKTDEIQEYADDSISSHLYKNCGLEAVEKEIVEYAQRYAFYNKCQQGSVYLQNAIDKCVKNVGKAEEKLDEALNEAKEHFDDKKGKLCAALESKKKDITVYNTEFQKLMECDFRKFTIENNIVEGNYINYIIENNIVEGDLKNYIIKNNIVVGTKPLKEKLHSKWKEYKETEKGDKKKKENGWALSQIQRYVDSLYNDLLSGFSKLSNERIVSFWDNKSEEFKGECIRIVHDSEALTTEQKSILERIVMSRNDMDMHRVEINLRKIGAIVHKSILWIKLKEEIFNSNKCVDELVKMFNDEARTKFASTELDNEESFKRWTDGLISTLVEELCKFNSDLDSYRKKIDSINKEIRVKEDCIKLLKESQIYIDDLLDIQGGIK